MKPAPKPEIICLMLGSIDGRLHPSRYTASPDGERKTWSAAYEKLHGELKGDAWLVGRVTMAEMSKGVPHAPATYETPARPVHVAKKADQYAVALDPSGKVHFTGDAVGGDHAVVLLGRDVADSHLAELTADGVSYIVAETAEMDVAPMLGTLRERFGIKKLLLEGGGTINGSLMAAGVVDELNVLIAPALDARKGADGIVEHGEEGLAGKVRLSLQAMDRLDHGLVHLRYRVSAE